MRRSMGGRQVLVSGAVAAIASGLAGLGELPYVCAPGSEMYLSSAVTAAGALRLFSRAR
jgi:hypothetical protein